MEECKRAAEADRLSDAEFEALFDLAAVIPTTRQGAAELLRYAAKVEREGQRALADESGNSHPLAYFAVPRLSRI